MSGPDEHLDGIGFRKSTNSKKNKVLLALALAKIVSYLHCMSCEVKRSRE